MNKRIIAILLSFSLIIGFTAIPVSAATTADALKILRRVASGDHTVTTADAIAVLRKVANEKTLEVVNKPYEIIISVEPNNVKLVDIFNTELKILLTNPSNNEIVFFLPQQFLEYFNGFEWIPIHTFDEITMVDALMSFLPDALPDLGRVMFELYDFDFIPGLYRVIYSTKDYGEFTIS